MFNTEMGLVFDITTYILQNRVAIAIAHQR